MHKQKNHIRIYYQSVFNTKLKAISIKKMVNLIFANEGCEFKSLDIIFCTDDYLLDINRNFLKHHNYTDIITFNYSDSGIEGEIYISFERLSENARELNIHTSQEVLRLIIHGILHLCGYTDKTLKQKLKMTKLENSYLSLIDE